VGRLANFLDLPMPIFRPLGQKRNDYEKWMRLYDPPRKEGEDGGACKDAPDLGPHTGLQSEAGLADRGGAPADLHSSGLNNSAARRADCATLSKYSEFTSMS
jgi:hypothetical protein